MPDNRPDFMKKNVINESAMTEAFKQGLQEGTANRDMTTLYVVSISFEGTKLNERTFEDKELAMKFAIDNLDTVGQSVTIDVKWSPANHTTPAGTQSSALTAGDPDEEIVDAEVIGEG